MVVVHDNKRGPLDHAILARIGCQRRRAGSKHHHRGYPCGHNLHARVLEVVYADCHIAFRLTGCDDCVIIMSGSSRRAGDIVFNCLDLKAIRLHQVPYIQFVVLNDLLLFDFQSFCTRKHFLVFLYTNTN